ncbi:sugar MFS transporter [Alishewanella sp. SMS8]|uniref:MFS transporter n=1 Tax=Alishewanella sp. SMS8 TaxID=2994676 RepID=UPI002741CB52|nr:MFS transporter [Alishewanella sp. SMS8]MDP5205703.1 MFS transporter [Alishewanella sp. SMS9]MDP5460585.1 MFS transporter [Alishewanella sp. SMS8]
MSRAAPTVVIFSGFFLLGNLIILWGILLPDMAKDLQMSTSISGLFFSLLSMGAIFGAVMGGKYAQRFHFLRLFASLALVETLLLLLFSFITSWQLLLPLIVLVGMTYAVMFTVGHTLIARLFANKRAAMMGLMDFMFSLGTLAAPLWVVVLFWVLDDWRWPLRFIALGLLLLGFYSLYVAKVQPQMASKAEHKGSSLSYVKVLRQPLFLLMFLVMIGYGAAEWGQGNWFVSYAADGIGIETEQARLLLAWFTGGMVLSRLGFALLLRWCSPAQLMLLLASLALSGALLLKLSVGLPQLTAGNVLLGLGIGGLFPLMLATAMDIDSENGPVLSGIASIGTSVGFQFAGLATGVWAQQAGILQAYWLVPLACAWLLLMILLFCRRLTPLTASA